MSRQIDDPKENVIKEMQEAINGDQLRTFQKILMEALKQNPPLITANDLELLFTENNRMYGGEKQENRGNNCMKYLSRARTTLYVIEQEAEKQAAKQAEKQERLAQIKPATDKLDKAVSVLRDLPYSEDENAQKIMRIAEDLDFGLCHIKGLLENGKLKLDQWQKAAEVLITDAKEKLKDAPVGITGDYSNSGKLKNDLTERLEGIHKSINPKADPYYGFVEIAPVLRKAENDGQAKPDTNLSILNIAIDLLKAFDQHKARGENSKAIKEIARNLHEELSTITQRGTVTEKEMGQAEKYIQAAKAALEKAEIGPWLGNSSESGKLKIELTARLGAIHKTINPEANPSKKAETHPQRTPLSTLFAQPKDKKQEGDQSASSSNIIKPSP